MRRLAFVLLVLVVVVGLISALVAGYGLFTVRRPWPKTDGAVRVDGLREETTVIRDSWGIPHIYASNSHDLFFAQGYVHAQDRFWQMEFNRRVGSGRLAEILGESALDSDRFIRTLGWHRTAAEELKQMDAEVLAALEAYAEGVNAYISTYRGRLGLEFTMLGLTGVQFEPEPWEPLHTITWAKVMAWDLGGNRRDELVRAHIAARFDPSAVEALLPSYPDDYPIIVPHPLTEASLDTLPLAFFDAYVWGSGKEIGSNNWVVAGERTETGMPILANDPHLGIQMPSIWYEIGLHCQPVSSDCPYNVVGASFASTPGVIIGHNDRIAWGVTNLGPDVQDLFIERVNPENPNQYEYEGEWVEMQTIREEITVAKREEPVVVRVRITRHGPIINDVIGGTEENWTFGWQPLALSWTGLQPGTLMRSVLLLDRASNWDDFREALSYWDAPSQNFVYADVEGNIGYQAPGRIPIRASGDGSVPVPGWTGEYEWVDYIPFDDLPRSFNPEEGYIVTANNAVVKPDFPYFISRNWAPGYRARRIVELLEADASLSVTDMQAIQGDSNPVWGEDVLPYLLVLPVTGTGRSESDARRLTEALELLRMWDGRADRDSAGAALFEAFRLRVIDLTFGDELGEQLLEKARSSLGVALVEMLEDESSIWFDNVNTRPVENRDEILLQALEAAVEDLHESLGRNMDKWRWGDLHTATFVNQSLGRCGIPIIESIFNRGPVPVDGTIATVNNTGYSLSAPYEVRSVPSYRQVVDLQDWTRSVSMHTTGQSGHPYHRHYDDMIDPWRDIEYHPMLWGRADVEADAEGTLVLMPK
ncbi:MAG TPA: penicillin acylase family protein [Chloroflexi bacterium]|nr:penicillin acylase family protein [Chloroflexota bacterium]